MNRLISTTLVIAALTLLLIGVGLGRPALYQDTSEVTDVACDKCHTCEAPTARDVCLKPCYRHTAWSQSTIHDLGEAPDSILLDALAAEYLPILFDHKPHAAMSGMSDNCGTCHHYSPEGEIPPCRSCHPKDASTINSSKPDLRTAYHRQCLVCHSQWAHEALCDVCHAQPAEGDTKEMFVRGGPILPTVNVPVSKTYSTSYQPAPVVTFQHIEHIELLEFDCVQCHQHENCRFCHDQVNREGLNKPMLQIHSICSECHEIGSELASDNNCGECHDSQAREPIFHSIVGFNLPKYLQHEGCDGCHPKRETKGTPRGM